MTRVAPRSNVARRGVGGGRVGRGLARGASRTTLARRERRGGRKLRADAEAPRRTRARPPTCTGRARAGAPRPENLSEGSASSDDDTWISPTRASPPNALAHPAPRITSPRAIDATSMPPAALAVAASRARRRPRVPRAPTVSDAPRAPSRPRPRATRGRRRRRRRSPRASSTRQACTTQASSPPDSPRADPPRATPPVRADRHQGVHHVAVIVESLQRSMDFTSGSSACP